jgi:hypothetical protein
MTPEQREAIIDAIPDGIDIWERDEEPADYLRDWRWWRRQLSHPHVDGHGYCKTCGPAVSCTLHVFHDAVIASVVRQLDQLGVLRTLDEATPADTKTEQLKPGRIQINFGPPPQQEPPIIQVRQYIGHEGWMQA